MKSKFEFRPITQVYCDPVTSVFRPGIPFGIEYSRGDMVLLHPEITASKIFLNSNILRDAILSNKEFVEEALGLKIIDAREAEAPVEVVEAPKKETKPKKTSKKEVPEVTEVVIEGVNEVPEGEEVKEEVVIDAPVEVAEEITSSLILEEEPLVEEK